MAATVEPVIQAMRRLHGRDARSDDEGIARAEFALHAKAAA